MVKRFVIILSFIFMPIFAEAADWQIEPKESAITFTAVQNKAPVTGSFTKFDGDIRFDLENLATNHVRIVIDMNSVTAFYAEVATSLKAPEWFDVKLFPQAVFEANKFTKTGDKKYNAEGTLIIRDKTIPLTLPFIMDEYSETKAIAKGSATIKRSDFGIGQGEWAKTDSVKDEVKIEFKLTARKL